MITRMGTRPRACKSIPYTKPSMFNPSRNDPVRFGIPDINATGRAGVIEMDTDSWLDIIMKLTTSAEAAVCENQSKMIYNTFNHLDRIPEASLFDVSEASFELLLAGGVEVTVQYDDTIIDKLASGGGEIECEMAARGVAPAIFASFCINNTLHHANYAKVSQRSYFSLSDYLVDHRQSVGDPIKRPSINVPAFQEQISEITVAISRKLRKAADNGVIKLDMTADDIVFCPKLVEDEDGEITATGYTFGNEQGLPHIQNFHNAVRTHYTAFNDLAYFVMNAQLHAHIRAYHGSGIQQLMMRRLWGVDAKNRVMNPDELAEDFESLSMKATLERIRDNSTSSINTFLKEITSDTAILSMMKNIDMNTSDDDPIDDAHMLADISESFLKMVNSQTDQHLATLSVFPLTTAAAGHSDTRHAKQLDTRIFHCIIPSMRACASSDNVEMVAERALRFEHAILSN